MDADRIIGALETLTAAEFRRVAARVHELQAVYETWRSPDAEAPAELLHEHVTYRQEYVRCGKASCKRCAAGQGHGPYWYAYWSTGGRTRSKYIGKTRPIGADLQPVEPETPVSIPLLEPAAVKVAETTSSPASEPDLGPLPLMVWVRPGSKKRHLSLDAQQTLCGLPLAWAEPLPAGVFAHDDCQRCRRQAKVLGRTCRDCDVPLLREAAPGRCYSCVAAGRPQ
jgi:hypothetical protein